MPGPRRLAPFRGRVAYPSYVDESLFGNPEPEGFGPNETAIRMARSMLEALDIVRRGDEAVENAEEGIFLGKLGRDATANERLETLDAVR